MLEFYNPALVAEKEHSQILIGYKSLVAQNSAVDVNSNYIFYEKVSPRIGYLSGSFILKEKNNKTHGLGAYIRQYTYRPFSKLSAGINYGLGIQLNEKTKIGMGVSLKLISSSINFDYVRFIDDFSEPLRATNLGTHRSTWLEPNIGVYLNKKRYELGVSLLNILQKNSSLPIVSGFEAAGNTSYNPDRLHLYFNYSFDIDSSDFKIITGTQLILYPSNVSSILTVNVENKYAGLGIAYRHLSGISFLASIKAKGLKFSYSYEVITTDLKSFGNYGLSQELFISYSLNKKKTTPSTSL